MKTTIELAKECGISENIAIEPSEIFLEISQLDQFRKLVEQEFIARCENVAQVDTKDEWNTGNYAQPVHWHKEIAWGLPLFTLPKD